MTRPSRSAGAGGRCGSADNRGGRLYGCVLGNTSAPQEWPGDRFDMVWVFDLDDSSGAYRFSQVPELLLPGDSAEPIPVSAT